MAEDRMIRASMRESEKVNSWPIELRYFWTQLWGYCDSHGRGRRDARLVFAGTFPMDEEVDSKRVERWMRSLEIAKVIEPYEVDGKRYFQCVNWHEHQEITYFKKTDIPDQFGVIPKAGKVSAKDLESSRNIQNIPAQGEGEGEIEGEGESAKRAAPSKFCQSHPKGTASKCGGCGEARRRHEAWEKANAPAPTPTVPGIMSAPDCETHAHYPKHGCPRCAEEAAA